MSETCTILVCGDPSRGDDGAALAGVARLPAAVALRVTVRNVGRLEPDELVAATARGACLVLDAVRGVEPGSVVELPLADLLADEAPTPATSHAVPFGLVIGLAEALGADLGEATFLGIGGEDFTLGARLSDPVRAGLDAFARSIARAAIEGSARACA
jgi:hydrogenase maturation protease